MKYLLTGGGTGGHVYPALAVADELRRRDPEAKFLYVGVRGRLEESVVPARGYPLRFVHARPFPRSRSPFALVWFALHLSLGILVASVLLLHFRPHVIFGTGGFVSAPIMFACGVLRRLGLCRARLFVYSPDAQPGLLNQIAGRLADRIGVVFEQAGRWFDMKRVAIVGFPVRRELLALDAVDSGSICTPTSAHSAPAIAALDAGKHVLVEKPMAATTAEARQMVDAADRSGKMLMV